MRVLIAAWLLLLPAGGTRAIDNASYTDLLREHVRDGHVDYAALCTDDRLRDYTVALSATDPADLADDAERLAFWINVYNAFTLQIICDNYPLESINELHLGGLYVGSALNKTVWDRKFIVINGEEMSLNHIEHDIVRAEFDDPRAHFALVCASKSCPPLRSEAFEGRKLDAQLDEQGRLFLADAQRNRFDADKKIAYLNKIFDWYKGDFGGNDRERLTYIARFVPPAVAASLRDDPWKIEHLDYDWSLND